MKNDEVLLSDMSLCEPPSALDNWMGPGKWGVMPYETEAFSGKMLWSAADLGVPEVSLSLPVSGWYKIYIGTHYADVGPTREKMISENSFYQSLRVRLSSDKSDWHIEPEQFGRQGEKYLHLNTERRYHIVETLWRAVNLKEGDSIIFAPAKGTGMRDMTANISSVRLVPMTEDEVQLFEPVPGDAPSRRLIAIHDGQFTGNQPSSDEEVGEWIEPFKDSDFDIILWSASRGEGSLYATKISTPVNAFYHASIDPFYRGADLPKAIAAGFDPLESAVRMAHECGLKIFGSIRMIGAKLPPNQGPFQLPSVFWDHPEYRGRTLEGDYLGTYSLAHPEVRKMFIDLFREQAENYDLDGVHLHFNRGYPFILYEDVALEGFKKETGIDARTLDTHEERWHAYKTGIITDYVRSIRGMLDEVGKKRGRDFDFAVHVGNSLTNCRYIKLDVPTWVREGLVQHVVVHPAYSGEGIESKAITREVYEEWQAELGDREAKIYVDVYPRHMPAEDLRARAGEYHSWNVDGLCYWDTYQRMAYSSLVAMMRLSGHAEDMQERKGLGDDFLRVFPLKTILGLSMDRRYWPGNNG